jgi:hypothetical protein
LTTLETPKKSPKKQKNSQSQFRRRYEKIPSYDIGEDWAHFNEERERERNRIVRYFHFTHTSLHIPPPPPPEENGTKENFNKF